HFDWSLYSYPQSGCQPKVLKNRAWLRNFNLTRSFCRRIWRMKRLVTLSAAARELDISRRTVQRYCRREPGLIEQSKVNLEGLKAVIAYCKRADARGFPLGRTRWLRLPLNAQRKEKPIIRRTLNQRRE